MGALLRRMDAVSVLENALAAWKAPLLFALLCSLVANLILSSWQWRTIYKEMGHGIPLVEHIFVKSALYPLRAILPFRSGDLGRAVYMAIHHHVPPARSVAAQVLILAVNTSILLYCSVIGFLIASLWTFAALAFLALSTLVVGSLLARNYLLLFENPSREGSWFRRKLHQMHPLAAIPLRNLLPVGLLGIVTLMGQVVTFSLIVTSLRLAIPAHVLFGFVPIIMLAGGLPISFLGLGPREWTAVALLAPYASPQLLMSLGILFSTIDQVVLVLIGLIALAPFIYSCRVTDWPSVMEW